MKTPENVDELTHLIICLTDFYGGAFYNEYGTFVKEFPFMNIGETITALVKKLRSKGIFIGKIYKVSSTNILEDIRPSILVVQRMNL